jgi:hypothetical protein
MISVLDTTYESQHSQTSVIRRTSAYLMICKVGCIFRDSTKRVENKHIKHDLSCFKSLMLFSCVDCRIVMK